MTSKEALELLELILNNHSIMLEVDDNRMECLNVIKQDLDRLEVLEKEKTELLLAHSRVLKSSSETNSLTLDILKENEKLKKAIEILKRTYAFYVVKCELYWINHKNSGLFELTQQEYELLKEVLNNESRID